MSEQIQSVDVRAKYADFRPINPSDLDMAFGAATSFKTYAPMYLGYHNCELRDSDCKQFWREVVTQWFFGGLPKGSKFVPREGIDEKAALRHLQTVLGSWEPDHNSKERIAAFLLDLWFTDFTPGEGFKPHALEILNSTRKELPSA